MARSKAAGSKVISLFNCSPFHSVNGNHVPAHIAPLISTDDDHHLCPTSIYRPQAFRLPASMTSAGFAVGNDRAISCHASAILLSLTIWQASAVAKRVPLPRIRLDQQSNSTVVHRLVKEDKNDRPFHDRVADSLPPTCVNIYPRDTELSVICPWRTAHRASPNKGSSPHPV